MYLLYVISNFIRKLRQSLGIFHRESSPSQIVVSLAKSVNRLWSITNRYSEKKTKVLSK